MSAKPFDSTAPADTGALDVVSHALEGATIPTVASAVMFPVASSR